MRFHKSGGFITGLWSLCIICAVFAGICFDNVQADSCLADQTAGNPAETAVVSGSFCGGTAAPSVLRGVRRGVLSGQAYVSEISVQGGYAFIPRKTAQRAASRSLLGSVLFLLLGGIFLSAFFSRQTAFFSDGLCEVISNTVILRYIHGQDGAKS